MTAFPLPARLVSVGDVLTDKQGAHKRFVVDRDDTSNRHGRIILRTACRPDGRPSGSTVTDPDTTLYVWSERPVNDCPPWHH